MTGNRLGIQATELGTVDDVDLNYTHAAENAVVSSRPHILVASPTSISGEVRIHVASMPRVLVNRFAYRCVTLDLHVNQSPQWVRGGVLHNGHPKPLEYIKVNAVVPGTFTRSGIVLICTGCDYLFVVRKHEVKSTTEEATYEFLGPAVCMYKFDEVGGGEGKITYSAINTNDIGRLEEHGKSLLPQQGHI